MAPPSASPSEHSDDGRPETGPAKYPKAPPGPKPVTDPGPVSELGPKVAVPRDDAPEARWVGTSMESGGRAEGVALRRLEGGSGRPQGSGSGQAAWS